MEKWECYFDLVSRQALWAAVNVYNPHRASAWEYFTRKERQNFPEWIRVWPFHQWVFVFEILERSVSNSDHHWNGAEKSLLCSLNGKRLLDRPFSLLLKALVLCAFTGKCWEYFDNFTVLLREKAFSIQSESPWGAGPRPFPLYKKRKGKLLGCFSVLVALKPQRKPLQITLSKNLFKRNLFINVLLIFIQIFEQKRRVWFHSRNTELSRQLFSLHHLHLFLCWAVSQTPPELWLFCLLLD